MSGFLSEGVILETGPDGDPFRAQVFDRATGMVIGDEGEIYVERWSMDHGYDDATHMKIDLAVRGSYGEISRVTTWVHTIRMREETVGEIFKSGVSVTIEAEEGNPSNRAYAVRDSDTGWKMAGVDSVDIVSRTKSPYQSAAFAVVVRFISGDTIEFPIHRLTASTYGLDTTTEGE